MIRAEYLQSPEVMEFIDWLIPRLDQDGTFTHEYIDRRSGQMWQCVSLFDAFDKYRWRFNLQEINGKRYAGSTFTENAAALTILRNELRRSLQSGNPHSLRDASCMVFEWGGVRMGNINWAVKQGDNLIATFRNGMRVLNPKLANDGVQFTSRFNSGLSKIYSLLLDGFCIYDSRVGAALGHLAVRYCQQNAIPAIPILLRFPWAPPNEYHALNPKNRNPCIGTLIMGQIGDDCNHARWNIRASWLLMELSRRSQRFSNQLDPLRAIEAALFMIGYDLGRIGIQANIAQHPQLAQMQPNGNFPFTTHGKGHAFQVDLIPQDNTLVFSYPIKPKGAQRKNDVFSLQDIYNICVYLYNQFGRNPFPLANNVELLGNNDEQPGLGMAIRTLPASVTKSQAASYLGRYLEEVGVFNLANNRPARWSLNVQPHNATQLVLDYHQDV